MAEKDMKTNSNSPQRTLWAVSMAELPPAPKGEEWSKIAPLEGRKGRGGRIAYRWQLKKL